MKKTIVFSIGAILAACTLSDGAADSMCVPERTGKLVGLIDPSDRQIMEITGASRVRRALEGQPMTMELLPFRATVILDPKTRRVVQANCS